MTRPRRGPSSFTCLGTLNQKKKRVWKPGDRTAYICLPRRDQRQEQKCREEAKAYQGAVTLTTRVLLVSSLISQVSIFASLPEVLGRERTEVQAFPCREVFLECRCFCLYNINNNTHHILSMYSVLGAILGVLWTSPHLIITEPCSVGIILPMLQRRKLRFRKVGLYLL